MVAAGVQTFLDQLAQALVGQFFLVTPESFRRYSPVMPCGPERTCWSTLLRMASGRAKLMVLVPMESMTPRPIDYQ